MSLGAIFNVVSFRKNPHVKSIFRKGLWGFTERYRRRWSRLDEGTRVLIYGDGGVRMAGYVKSRYESREPIDEWVENPTGYPLRVTLDLINKSVYGIKPLERAELVNKYGIGLAKLGFRGFALVLFGPGGTYPLEKFDEIWSEFLRRNKFKERPPPEEGKETSPLEKYVKTAIDVIRQFPPKRWTEENTKAALIDPLLEVLGWNVHKLDEVERGYQVTVGTKSFKVDYALKISGRVKIFLEAKALNRKLDPFVKQAVSYAKVKDVRWVVLANGRELRVYDAAYNFQLFKLSLNEYLKKADKLMLLSREGVEKGRLDRFGDREFHRQAVLKWFRESVNVIVKDIMRSNPNLKREVVRDVVEEILGELRLRGEFGG